MEFSAAAKKADNFIGQVLRCVLVDEDNTKKKLHLIVKLPPSDEWRRKAIKVEKFFHKEIYMYSTVLPALADCFKRKNLLSRDALFPCTARTYALLDEEEEQLVVLEDLRERGFAMQNKHAGLDAEHCCFVLKEVARIHAASLAMQRDNPKLHDSLSEHLVDSLFSSDDLHEVFKNAIKKYQAAIDDHFPLGSPKRNKVETFLEKYLVNMKKILAPNSTLCCITHGDLWVNNILFKYKQDTEIIEEVCLLDLQVSRYCSPIVDIWYFLAICTRRSTRKSAYKEIAKCYYDSLCSFLRDLGHDPEGIVPWSVFQEELRKNAIYGLAIAIIVLPAILLSEGEADAFEEKWKKNNADQIRLPAQAKERFVELLEEAVEEGYFWD